MILSLAAAFLSSCTESESDDNAILAAALIGSQSNASFHWVYKTDGNSFRCVAFDANYAEKEAEYNQKVAAWVEYVKKSSYSGEFSVETGTGGCPDIGTVVAKCTSYGFDGIEGNRLYYTNETGLSAMMAIYTAMGNGAPWNTNVKTECEEALPLQGATGTFECYDSSLCGSY